MERKHRPSACDAIRCLVPNAEALLSLMQIVNGRTRSVPGEVNLEMLAEIAVLVDYFDCLEAVEVFPESGFSGAWSQLL